MPSKETSGFCDESKLYETERIEEDLFDFEKEKKRLKKIIENNQSQKMIGLVGPYGAGKSSMLHELAKDEALKDKENYKWINFQAWEYPERKDLWDGFVLEVVEQLSGEVAKNNLLAQLEGKKDEPIRFFVPILLSALLSSSLLGTLYAWLTSSNRVTKCILTILTVLIILLSLKLKMFTRVRTIISEWPIRRVFELQSALDTHLKKNKKPLVLTIEDADRAGEEGMRFLETLKNYLKHLHDKEITTKPITTITAIGSTEKFYEKFDEYLKICDIIEHFKPEIKTRKFFADLLPENETEAEQLAALFDYLFEKDIVETPRLMKYLVREANESFKRQKAAGHTPDLRITILMQLSYIFTQEGDRIDSQSRNGNYAKGYGLSYKKHLLNENPANQCIKFQIHGSEMSKITCAFLSYLFHYPSGEIKTEDQKNEATFATSKELRTPRIQKAQLIKGENLKVDKTQTPQIDGLQLATDESGKQIIKIADYYLT